MNTDDTPVPVLELGKGQTKEGRLWVYLRAQTGLPPAAFYDYTPTRNKAGPLAILGDYRGYLQADAYAGYDELYAAGQVQEVACWAHARRKFYDLAKSGHSPLAAEALVWIKRLYQVEDGARELDDEARRRLRQDKALPILTDFKAWLSGQVRQLPPKGPLAQAMRYVLKRWEAFTRYLEQGYLAIDNIAAERALRGIAVGRNNWLFAGSDNGGQRAAIVYSLIETCRLNDI